MGWLTGWVGLGGAERRSREALRSAPWVLLLPTRAPALRRRSPWPAGLTWAHLLEAASFVGAQTISGKARPGIAPEAGAGDGHAAKYRAIAAMDRPTPD